MTADEIYDEVKKNGIPVGLDAWMPKESEAKEPTWKDYIPKLEKPTNAYWKAWAQYFYGRMEEAEAKARKEIDDLLAEEADKKEKEMLQIAAEYFG